MLKRKTLSGFKKWAPLLLVACLPLAGCVGDEFANDDLPLTPYGGSKLHPIKVVGNRATVADCGQWDVDATETDNNLMAPNHGCAVQANIAAMTVNKRDLVKARKMSRAPSASRVKAINGLTTASTTSSTTSTTAGTSAATTP